ncbi:SDR family NAD(P)-dependent oxidoreductase [Aquamicrobium defluvii]|nr:SDR family NAD(P)-dependent oxidoreductase [Aquamicrobium defluvii]TDR32105.1 NAD(P)-dependent dehydrogenase (short-subunit alcohol dehydrogenase family) [Aquamicrobium defluvii]
MTGYTVVTGAASGMGRAIAEALAKDGERLVLIDIDPLVHELSLPAGGDAIITRVADISDAESIRSILDRVNSEHGPTLKLVNNAAMMRNKPLAELSLDDWKKLLDVNLTGAFILSQAVGRHMRAAGDGAIVHIGSVAAAFGRNGGGAYSAAKAGIVGLSNTICVEWGAYGIRSNVVHPGLMRTPLSEAFYRDTHVNAQRRAQISLGRPGVGEDVAQVVRFLLSDGGRYMSGAEITVDGGFSRMALKNYPVPKI